VLRGAFLCARSEISFIQNLTLPAALEPEIIKLDKWVPLLCATHH
jgi:hypothetical protein